MRVLILGKNFSAEKFYEYFEKNQENIVFSNYKKNKNYIFLEDSIEILNFCQANEINLVLILDEKYINEGLEELLSMNNILTFSPSIDAISLSVSKVYAKKFMYKNKIKTPKFAVVDKPQIAYDFIKNNSFPFAIKPDIHNYLETTHFIENKKQTVKSLNEYLSKDNDKLILENYIDGRNIKVWVLTDGFRGEIIFISANYQNEITYFEPSFVTDEIRKKIEEEIIKKTLESINKENENEVEENSQYIGILGFDIVLDYNNEPYLIGYDSFFDDLNSIYPTQLLDIDWENVMSSTIIGDVFLKYNFKKKNLYALTYRDKKTNEINFISARTKTNLNRYIDELDLEIDNLEEIKKLWKF